MSTRFAFDLSGIVPRVLTSTERLVREVTDAIRAEWSAQAGAMTVSGPVPFSGHPDACFGP